jgi:uncharacterized protein YlxP (DUF503 family)
MVVAVLKISLSIPHAGSLKDKRRVLKSLKDRLRNGFNVSVAEIDDQDLWQTAKLGVAAVSESSAYVNGILSRIQDIISGFRDVVVTDFELEWR